MLPGMDQASPERVVLCTLTVEKFGGENEDNALFL